jgi:lipid-binding SYLF domain-containing protein
MPDVALAPDTWGMATFPRQLHSVRLIGLSVVLAFSVSGPSAAGPQASALREAETAIQRSAKNINAIPASILRRAYAVAVFPASPTEATVHEGSGVISAKGRRSNRWLPAIVSFKAKLRLSPGRNVGDIFIIALTPRGFSRLAQRGAPLRIDAGIPAGPVGQNTAEHVVADFVAYGQYRRVFAGVAVEQMTIDEDVEALNDLYGPDVDLQDVLDGGLKNAPRAALDWSNTLDAYVHRMD